MTHPKRIRRRRTKGSRMPEGARYVGRPGRYGNPFTTEDAIAAGYSADRAASAAKFAFKQWLTHHPMWSPPGKAFSPKIRDRILADLGDLRGHDLACWCKLCDAHQDGLPLGVECPDCAPCHADVLLEIANR